MVRARRIPPLAGLAVLFVAAPGAARAGVTAQLQPGYSSATTTSRDETGAETKLDSSQWIQRYRLSLDEQPYPLLRLSAGANLDWVNGDSESTGQPRQEIDARTWNTYARLSAGGPILNGGLDYTRSWDETDVRSGGISVPTPGSVRESFGGAVSWRPADLPTFTLRLSRSNAYDEGRQAFDQTTDSVLLSAAYKPQEELDLRYAIRYGNFDDHLTGLERSDLSNSVGATWTDKYLSGRGTLYLAYNIATRTTDTRAPAGTTVPVQQVPFAGLSTVESGLDTPLRVTLSPNAALVDGITGVSAGVNLGTTAGAGPILAFRDLGAQFSDVLTPVNRIDVYVDRALPAGLAALFAWSAYQSDDNVDWTPVPLAGPAVFNPVLLRFEVPIGRTQARYLKVVTQPLPASATLDPQFREIFVTELQFFNVTSAEEARGSRSDYAGNLNGTTRIMLVPNLGLAYDFSGFLTHAQDRPSTWSVVNGVSLSRRLDPVFAVAARVDRSDSDTGRGREGLNRWSASVTADPIPTFGAVAGYSGQLAETRDGNAVSNTGTLGARADLYEGVAVTANQSASLARSAEGVSSRSYLTAASASIVPNRFVTVTGTVSYSQGTQSGGGRPDRSDSRGVVEGGASLTPVPAVALSGSVTRQFGGTQRPATLAAFSAALSPFPGGDLQLRYSYTESYDGAADSRTRIHGPTARWNIRPGWYFDAGYTFQDASAPASSQETRAFNANLLITLR
jgi:hypothetical protein